MGFSDGILRNIECLVLVTCLQDVSAICKYVREIAIAAIFLQGLERWNKCYLLIGKIQFTRLPIFYMAIT